MHAIVDKTDKSCFLSLIIMEATNAVSLLIIKHVDFNGIVSTSTKFIMTSIGWWLLGMGWVFLCIGSPWYGSSQWASEHGFSMPASQWMLTTTWGFPRILHQASAYFVHCKISE